VVALVADTGNLMYLQAQKVELLGHPGRIGINNLPDQQLVAYGNDLCFHKLI
jgi:hypothetical protein